MRHPLIGHLHFPDLHFRSKLAVSILRVHARIEQTKWLLLNLVASCVMSYTCYVGFGIVEMNLFFIVSIFCMSFFFFCTNESLMEMITRIQQTRVAYGQNQSLPHSFLSEIWTNTHTRPSDQSKSYHLMEIKNTSYPKEFKQSTLHGSSKKRTISSSKLK